MGYTPPMRSKQPDRVTAHNPPKRLYQDIPSEAAKHEARTATRVKKASPAAEPDAVTPAVKKKKS